MTKIVIRTEINISILASITIYYVFSNPIIHEGVLGHGGAAILLGENHSRQIHTFKQGSLNWIFPYLVRMIAANRTTGKRNCGRFSSHCLYGSSVKKGKYPSFMALGHEPIQGIWPFDDLLCAIGDWYDVVTGLPSKRFDGCLTTLIGMVASWEPSSQRGPWMNSSVGY